MKELPGFGEQKAKIFVALLGKQLGVRPDGWESVSTPFSDPGSFRSVADITDAETLNRVRAFKQALKAANKAKATGRRGRLPHDSCGAFRTKASVKGAAGAGGAKRTTASKAGASTTKSVKTGRRTAASGTR